MLTMTSMCLSFPNNKNNHENTVFTFITAVRFSVLPGIWDSLDESWDTSLWIIND